MGILRSAERTALGTLDLLLLRTAMACALLALVLWYASMTVFQPGRMDALVETVLRSAHMQRTTAEEIYDQVRAANTSSGFTKSQAKQITAAMNADPRLKQMLVTDADGHAQIGTVPGKDIDPKQVDAVFHSAVQRVDPTLARSMADIHLHVTPAGLGLTASSVPTLKDTKTIATHAWPWLAGLALVLWLLAWLLSQQRSAVVGWLGHWLVRIALLQVVLLVVGPWLAVRYVNADWALKYATTAALWGSRVLVPIVVMGVVGVLLTLVARQTSPQAAT